MPKTEPNAIAAEISADFQTYLGKGIRFESFFSEPLSELRVEGLDTLLRVHFLLQEPQDEDQVVPSTFVKGLRDRIRNLKTETRRKTETVRGAVRGRIDWNETIKLRNQSPEPIDTRFACVEPHIRYQIKENMVLVRLLDIIEEILTEDLSYALEEPQDFTWVEPWVSAQNDNSASLASDFLNLMGKNVYLDRVQVEPGDITDRMIRSGTQSRLPLYREAAALLDQYRKLMNYQIDASLSIKLLSRTMIGPGEPENLFELYWAFQILDQFPSARYEVLKHGDGLVASWQTETFSYQLYHDSTGPDTFRLQERTEEVLDGKTSDYLERQVRITDRWDTISSDLFDRSSDRTLWGGRPDIIFVRTPIERDCPTDVFLGEVKYSQDREYLRSGLRELLEYIGFLRIGDQHAVPIDEIGTSTRVSGGLFVDGIPFNSEIHTPQTFDSVTVYQFGDEFLNPFG